MSLRYHNNQSNYGHRVAEEIYKNVLVEYEKRMQTEKADTVIFYDMFIDQLVNTVVQTCISKIETYPSNGEQVDHNALQSICNDIKQTFEMRN